MTAGRDDVLRTVEGEVGSRVVTLVVALHGDRDRVVEHLVDLGGSFRCVRYVPDAASRTATWTFREEPLSDAWELRVRKHRERTALDLAAQGRQVTVEQLERDGHGAWWTPAMLDEIEVVLGRELGVPQERSLDEYLARRRAGSDPPNPPLLPGPLAGVPLWLVAAASFATGAGLAAVGWLAGAGAAAFWWLP